MRKFSFEELSERRSFRIKNLACEELLESRTLRPRNHPRSLQCMTRLSVVGRVENTARYPESLQDGTPFHSMRQVNRLPSLFDRAGGAMLFIMVSFKLSEAAKFL